MHEQNNQSANIMDNIVSITRDEHYAVSVEEETKYPTNKTGYKKEPTRMQIKNAVIYSRSLSKESIVTMVQNINRKGGITFMAIVAISVLGASINQTQHDHLIILYLKCSGLASYLLAWYWISSKNEVRVATNKTVKQAFDRFLFSKLSPCIVPPCFE
jgi:hypothetical protein